ncbi:MAG: hypothetical protein R3199_03630 [Gemmatimonadota bacterium]|nr:hypothetical protein [Gemmatimonadota bacterium]
MERTARERDVVVDMEAGVEHLSRGTVRHVDRLLVVIEPYFRSLETGKRTVELGIELGIPRVEVVANKVRDGGDRTAIREFCEARGLEVVVEVPWDDAFREAERAGSAPLDFDPDAEAIRAIRGLVE